MRKTPLVEHAGEIRRQLARRLGIAHAEGLLSDETLALRLDLLFGSRVIDPSWLVGDLSGRSALRERVAGLTRVLISRARGFTGAVDEPPVLALDWSGAQEQLLVGRHPSCDIVLSHSGVSRLHARLAFRAGGWSLQDLDSTNGTRVNGAPVGRCRIRPGDEIIFGDQAVRID